MKRHLEVVVREPRLSLDKKSAERCLRLLDKLPDHPIPAGSLAVAFVDPAECADLHRRFFADPELTDVMTFPGDLLDDHAGDIAICPEVADEASTQSQLSFSEELTLYLVHAWLHLAGMKDNNSVGQAAMCAAEKSLMEHLRKGDAILKAAWQG